MIKLSQTELVEAVQAGMVVAGLYQGAWHQFPISMFLSGGEFFQMDHYLDPNEVFTIFYQNVTNPSLTQLINTIQNG